MIFRIELALVDCAIHYKRVDNNQKAREKLKVIWILAPRRMVLAHHILFYQKFEVFEPPKCCPCQLIRALQFLVPGPVLLGHLLGTDQSAFDLIAGQFKTSG